MDRELGNLSNWTSIQKSNRLYLTSKNMVGVWYGALWGVVDFKSVFLTVWNTKCDICGNFDHSALKWKFIFDGRRVTQDWKSLFRWSETCSLVFNLPKKNMSKTFFWFCFEGGWVVSSSRTEDLSDRSMTWFNPSVRRYVRVSCDLLEIILFLNVKGQMLSDRAIHPDSS